MQIRFTKMQGAGNDFVVLDETQGRLGLSPAQYRWLADRHFGVGADQILTVRPSPGLGLDFEYVIHNADGGEVEHCGNGARCFVRYVHDHGLSDRNPLRVKVKQGELSLLRLPDGRVTVDMGAPVFDLDRIPFDAAGLPPSAADRYQPWPLDFAGGQAGVATFAGANMTFSSVLAGDRISRPVVVDNCTFVAMASFPTGAPNHIHRLVETSLAVTTAARASGSITALASTPGGALWGTGKSGKLFNVGVTGALCSLSRPTALGLQRSLNSIRGVAFLDDGPVVGTDLGEIQALPLVP